MTSSRKSPQVELIELIHNYNINIDKREIFLTPHDTECEVDCLMSAEFVRNIQFLNNTNHHPILIHIGTAGGDWNYGMMIYDAIANSSSRIITISYAHARSMSSIVPQAADLRVIMPHTDFMIHEGYVSYEGTSKGAKHNMEWNNHLKRVMVDLYAEKCQDGQYFKDWSPKKIATFLQNKMDKKEDWYMTADEAVTYGFMDGVLGSKGFENIETIMG